MGEHGCETVAYFGGNEKVSPRIAREQAFRQGARAAVDERWNLAFDASLDLAYEKACALLRALHEQGVSPRECRVAGIDDLHQSASWNPSLTSIAVHPVEQGRVTARTLLDRLGHPELTPGRVPEPVLVRRSSCGCG